MLNLEIKKTQNLHFPLQLMADKKKLRTLGLDCRVKIGSNRQKPAKLNKFELGQMCYRTLNFQVDNLRVMFIRRSYKSSFLE